MSCEELLDQSLSLLALKDKFVRERIMGFVVKDVARVFGSTTSNQVQRPSEQLSWTVDFQGCVFSYVDRRYSIVP